MNIINRIQTVVSQWRHFPIFAVLFMAGCSSDGASETGELTGPNGALGPASAAYAVLNLNSGAVSLAAVAPNLSDPTLRSSRMVFRRVAGTGGDFFLGVFEVTQSQWMAITGTQPWTTIPVAVVDVGAISDRPAYNFSYRDLQTALSNFNTTFGAKLKTPSFEQWQFASAGGSTGSWSWGNATDHTTLSANAVVWETHGSGLGPHTVGTKAANGYGLYDMHGNVWEWTSPGTAVYGGSWNDSFRLAAIGAQKPISSTTSHALVGARLILTP